MLRTRGEFDGFMDHDDTVIDCHSSFSVLCICILLLQCAIVAKFSHPKQLLVL